MKFRRMNGIGKGKKGERYENMEGRMGLLAGRAMKKWCLLIFCTILSFYCGLPLQLIHIILMGYELFKKALQQPGLVGCHEDMSWIVDLLRYILSLFFEIEATTAGSQGIESFGSELEGRPEIFRMDQNDQQAQSALPPQSQIDLNFPPAPDPHPPIIFEGESRPLSQREENALERATSYHARLLDLVHSITRQNGQELTPDDCSFLRDFLLANLESEVNLPSLRRLINQLEIHGSQSRAFQKAKRSFDNEDI